MIKGAGSLYCIMLLAGASRAEELRFVHDQTTSMPLTKIEHHGNKLTVTGGMLADLERALAKELGVVPVLIATPRKRVEQMLSDGEGDVLCYYDPAWLNNAERYRWSAQFLSNSNLLVVGAASAIPGKPADLREGRIGTIIGYVYPELPQLTTEPGLLRDDAPDDETNFRKLLAGRTDYLLTHTLFLDYILRQQRDAAARLGGRLVIRSFETRCALSESSPVSVARFDAALAKLRKSGEYDAIINKYR